MKRFTYAVTRSSFDQEEYRMATSSGSGIETMLVTETGRASHSEREFESKMRLGQNSGFLKLARRNAPGRAVCGVVLRWNMVPLNVRKTRLNLRHPIGDESLPFRRRLAEPVLGEARLWFSPEQPVISRRGALLRLGRSEARCGCSVGRRGGIGETVKTTARNWTRRYWTRDLDRL